MSILDINAILKKVTKEMGSMLYCYLEPIRDYKIGLRLMARDSDILSMCEWVPRFKVIVFYYENRAKEEVIKILKSQLYMKLEPVKSSVVIEQLDDETPSYPIRKLKVKHNINKKKPLLLGWHESSCSTVETEVQSCSQTESLTQVDVVSQVDSCLEIITQVEMEDNIRAKSLQIMREEITT